MKGHFVSDLELLAAVKIGVQRRPYWKAEDRIHTLYKFAAAIIEHCEKFETEQFTLKELRSIAARIGIARYGETMQAELDIPKSAGVIKGPIKPCVYQLGYFHLC